jgi:hypothetical protein
MIFVQVGRLMKGSTSLHSGEVQLLEENCFSIIFDHRSRSSKGGSYTLGKDQQGRQQYTRKGTAREAAIH